MKSEQPLADAGPRRNRSERGREPPQDQLERHCKASAPVPRTAEDRGDDSPASVDHRPAAVSGLDPASEGDDDARADASP